MTERARVFLDTETQGLHLDRRAWEVALILRQPGHHDTERSWFIDIEDCDLANAEPIALDVGRFWQRHPQAHLVPLVGNLANVTPDLPATPPTAPVFREAEVLDVVAALTAGKAYVMGSNPAFDTQTLAARMAAYGITPGWHYHPVDVPDRATGWLTGQGREVPTNEKGDEKSDLIAKACGVDPAGYERHSALGDCRLFRDLWDAIQGAAGPVGDPTVAFHREEAAHMITIADRDRAEEWADRLANAIAEMIGVEIGEHSNLNAPWANALAALTAYSDTLRAAAVREVTR